MAEEQKKYKSILVNPEITMEYIYDNPLNFDDIRNNPILKPISEINKSYCDLHLTSTKGILEYEDEYKKLQELESINPRYTNTVLMASIKNITNIIKTIIYSQDLQIVSMKNAINEMIEISNDKYKYINDEKERIEKIREEMRKEFENEYKDKIVITKISEKKVTDEEIKNIEDDEFNKTFSELKKIAGEEEPEIKEVVPKKIYSSLLEREI
jgi:hypothetical protein